MLRARKRSALLPLALTAGATSLLLTIVAPVLAADPTKTVTADLDVSGGGDAATMPAGATTMLQLVVSPDTGTLGSLDLTAPDGYTLTGQPSSTRGTATISGNVVQVRGLKISPPAAVTVTFDATAPCSFVTSTWTLLAKQRNGTVYASTGDLDTTVGSPNSCSLSFAPGQPANTVVDDVITTVPYSEAFVPPHASTAVAVEVLRGDDARDTTFTGEIDLAVTNNAAWATLGGTTSNNAIDGVASFTPTLDKAQFGYVLEATYTYSDLSEITALSNGFQITNDFAICSGSTCSESSTGNDIISSEVSTGSSSSGDAITVGIGPASSTTFSCPGYTPVTSEVVGFDYIGDSDKVVADSISKDVMNRLPENGIAHVETCLASTFQFKEKDGTLADWGPTIGLYVGLLPDCKTKTQSYCIVSKTKDQAGVGIITYRVGKGDPGGRH